MWFTSERCIRSIVFCMCLATLFSASGLVQLHEVFFNLPSSFVSVNNNEKSIDNVTSERMYDRLVVVLIDAMRADMLLGSDVIYDKIKYSDQSQSDLSKNMIYTRQLVSSGEAIAYIAHASVPTVTMPRLKALLTGKPPAFIDILKNFNSAALQDDNLIDLFRTHGDRIVFYGDDTWLKLFPKAFERSDGTSGFFALDTKEVDDNVTRHLREELDPLMKHHKSRDWDVLVLHYLGLDHVGHLRGPRSSMMVDKLHEMDSVIQLIHESVIQQDEVRRAESTAHSVKPTLILLCSDHGMSEIGNHGGATLEESSALMAFMRGDRIPLGSLSQPSQRRLQVDLVPTLASLFGLQVPLHNTGLLLDDVVRASSNGSNEESSLFLLRSLYANFQQLYQLAQIKLPASAMVRLIDLKKTLTDSVMHFEQKITDKTQVIKSLRVACEEVQKAVGQSDGSEYNVLLIVSGVLLLLLCGVYAGMVHPFTPHNPKGDRTMHRIVLFGGSVIQIIGLSSSSWIENEHATAFFTVTCAWVALLFDHVHQISKSPPKVMRKIIILLIVLLVCNRLLRARNQVINFGRLNGIPLNSSLPGYAFATDDSLSILSTHQLYEFVSYPVSLVLNYVLITFIIIWKAIRRIIAPCSEIWLSIGITVLFTVGMISSGLCAYYSHDSPEQVSATAASSSGADTAAQFVYAIVVTLILAVVIIVSSHRYNHLRHLALSMIEMTVWLLVTIVQRDSNLSTLVILSIQSVVIVLFQHEYKLHVQEITLLTLWLSSTAFFSLGNSHLVTTIDITQSYHGLNSYSQGIVGFLTFVSVFSGPLIVLVSSLDWIRLSPACNIPSKLLAAWTLIQYQAFRMGIYSIIVFLMRFHLFIWSVFAPKMLYEVMFTFIMGVFIIML